MKKKNIGICAITLIIAGLMITSAVSIPAAEDATENIEIKIEKIERVEQRLEMKSTPMSVPLKHVSKTVGDPEFNYEGDQIHPAFGTGATGQYMAAYWDEGNEQIIWTYSNEDGVYYDVGGDYPSIKLWDGTRFFGTFVPDYMDLDGGATYVFETTDPTDFDTYALRYWDWSDDGWHDIMDNEIAVDNSQEAWEWGFTSLIASTTYTDPAIVDGPFIHYQTAEDGYATISWYNEIVGCEHTDAAIDKVTADTYAVYDWPGEGTWGLFIRLDHFEDWDADGVGYTFSLEGNVKCPAVAANNGNIVILVETDVNGNKDILCLSGNSLETLEGSYVTMGTGDEMYPDIRHVEDTTFICTFVEDNKLYTSITEDAGATWSAPSLIEENVEDEYKTADITDFASEVMYEVDNGYDLDIYRAPLAGGTEVPIIEIKSISGGIGVSAVITNTGTADATDVEYTITATGGILDKINKEVTDTISSLAIGAEETISLPMLIGLGKVSITVTAGSASETVEGTQILVYTMI